MNNEEIRDVLYETSVSILEAAAFLFIDETEVDLSCIKDFELCGGEINFNGHTNGKVVILMAESIADIIARNMLGMDEESVIENNQRKDAVLEILNMITGNLLTSVFGDQVVFKLNMPEFIKSEEISDSLPETTVAISVESSPLLIAIQFCN